MTLMLQPILLGVVLIGMTVGVHAIGTATMIKFLHRYRLTLFRPHRPWSGLTVLTLTALYLLALHAAEIVLWAVSYHKIAKVAELANFEEALYFSIVTFTALGYGDITLSGAWRILSGMEAMNGLLLFGWSTALLYAVVRRLWTSTES